MLSGSKTRQSKYVEVNYRIELVTLTCKSRRLCYTEKTQETPKHLIALHRCATGTLCHIRIFRGGVVSTKFSYIKTRRRVSEAIADVARPNSKYISIDRLESNVRRLRVNIP